MAKDLGRRVFQAAQESDDWIASGTRGWNCGEHRSAPQGHSGFGKLVDGCFGNLCHKHRVGIKDVLEGKRKMRDKGYRKMCGKISE